MGSPGSVAIHWRHATFLPKGESRENAKMTVKILLHSSLQKK